MSTTAILFGGGAKPKRTVVLTSGSGVFTPLEPNSWITVTLQAPGAGGGASSGFLNDGTVSGRRGGGGGAAGEWIQVRFRMENATASWAMGAPGVGGVTDNQYGTAGGNVLFGNLVAQGGGSATSHNMASTTSRGRGGYCGKNSWSISGGHAGRGSERPLIAAPASVAGEAGTPPGVDLAETFIAGSTPGVASGTGLGSGGGGGASVLGPGGNGGDTSTSLVTPGQTPSGYGGGGGGGGATTAGISAGGNGAPGIIIVEEWGAQA